MVSYKPPSASGGLPSWLPPLTPVARIDRSLTLVAKVDRLHRSLTLTGMLVPYPSVPVFPQPQPLRGRTTSKWRGYGQKPLRRVLVINCYFPYFLFDRGHFVGCFLCYYIGLGSRKLFQPDSDCDNLSSPVLLNQPKLSEFPLAQPKKNDQTKKYVSQIF